MIRQGEIYWCDLGTPVGSEPGFHRPVVIIQNDVFNRSSIGTAIVCVLTTNLSYTRARLNVLLEEGEGGLQEQSVVNVSQIASVDRRMLGQQIGRLSIHRIEQINRGVARLIEPSAP